jgi:hypothetical protein
MGVIASKDDLFGYTIAVYMFEISDLDLTFDKQQAMVDTTDYFDDFCLKREDAQKRSPFLHCIKRNRFVFK